MRVLQQLEPCWLAGCMQDTDMSCSSWWVACWQMRETLASNGRVAAYICSKCCGVYWRGFTGWATLTANRLIRVGQALTLLYRLQVYPGTQHSFAVRGEMFSFQARSLCSLSCICCGGHSSPAQQLAVHVLLSEVAKCTAERHPSISALATGTQLLSLKTRAAAVLALVGILRSTSCVHLKHSCARPLHELQRCKSCFACRLARIRTTLQALLRLQPSTMPRPSSTSTPELRSSFCSPLPHPLLISRSATCQNPLPLNAT